MCDFDWILAIKMNIDTLRIVGLWPDHQVYKLNFYTLYAIISVIVFIDGAILFQIMHLVFDKTNLESFTGPIFIILTQLLGSIKIFYYISNVGIIRHLIETLRTDMVQPAKKQLHLIKKSLDIWKLIYVTFWTLVSMTAFLWSIYPFLDKSYLEYNLPFPARYPYDTRHSPLYEISYGHQVIGLFFVSIASLNIDTLIAALIMYIGIQCDLLCDNLKNSKPNDTLHKQIVSYIKHHQNILR